MTVDEAGQSLVILVPSCKEGEKIKEYELEENLCKVGKIEVSTLAGVVTLDKAFEGTYVTSANMMPSPPVIINTVEGKIGNSLIIARPPEIIRASKDAAKSKRELEQEELEAIQASQMSQRMDKEPEATATLMPYSFDSGKTGCNPTTNICVRWERPDGDTIQARGRGVAFRQSEDHYAEVKTQGYESNTSIEIIHDDNLASAIIGSGDPGGNVVRIKQNSGVLRR
jgi:hypothetical protein